MLVWSTQIPVIPSKTTHDLTSLCQRWLIGSPHSPWTGSDFRGAENRDTVTFQKDGQNVTLASFETKEGSWCAFLHFWRDDQRREWTTEICGWRTRLHFTVTVQVHCKTIDFAARVPTPKKPYVVRQILDELGGDLDGNLLVSQEPIFLGEGDVDLAARILRGETDNFLPVVYASSTWQNQTAIDAAKLAQWAAGMAHVVVEPSRHFSFALAQAVDESNPYEGALSVCWPRGAGRQTRFFPYHFKSRVELASAIADVIRRALTGRRPDHRCTWDFIRERISRARIESLRCAGKAEIDAYASEFDAELAAKNARLDQAEREIARLKAELARVNNPVRRGGEAVLTAGKERELYLGEQRDAVLYALDVAKDYVVSGGRVKTIIESVLVANPATGERQRLDEAIRDAIGKCNGLGVKERRMLEELGFAISEEGKHHKLVFRGDDRYTFAMAKTGSDWRGMKNWVSDVTKRLFR